MYTLYYCPSTASMVVHLALLEIGAEHELKLVDFETRQQKDAAYLALNPNGVVPTLVIDGKAYIESAALLMMLAERHPEAGLVPAAGSTEHDLWRQWLVYLSNDLQSTFRFWFYPGDLGYTEHPEPVRLALQHKIETIWSHLETHLNKNGPYLLGEQFSAADLFLTMLMRWSRNMPKPATEWPALNELTHLVTSRPSWKKMHAIEALSTWPEVKPE
ncbi:glutathione S-transferase family protein [Undibacterium jejuense]|uniref:Glutathione S-transferase family protein n=1 Tax=Undibacterium jejuense TaxID=1344949 RepID=A0A923HQD3_9BURK|nr:glutathione S-transferase family protein [Undibacterium jejuense]MBC3862793.1 glutathione S-transferase family protein [Undibacterium jejuense]